MIGTLRKHQTWLWMIIIGFTVVSFVWYFSPYQRMNGSQRGGLNLGSINGEAITEEAYVNARNEIMLRSFCLTGRWPDEDAMKEGGAVERDTYQWMLLLQKQNQLGIHISTALVARAAKGMLNHLEQAGIIRSPQYFREQVLPSKGMQLADFERFARHYLGVEELINTFGLPGKLVTPQEVRELYQREHQEVATEAVFFSASNHLAGVPVPPGAIEQFYTNREAMYRLPERVQVNYVQFDLTNFTRAANEELAKLTNLDLEISEAYQREGTNLLEKLHAHSLAEAKEKYHNATRIQIEFHLARKAATEFASPLFDMQPMRAANLDKLAKEKGLKVRTTAPFDLENGPTDLGAGPDFAQKAFALTPDYPFAGPVLGTNAVYIIALEKKLPSEIPSFDKIRDRVVQDYRFSQALNLARKAGEAFARTLTNGLAQGRTFAGLCVSAKLQPVSVPPFSLSTRELPEVEDYLSLNEFKQLVFTTRVGTASDFQPTSDGGVIVYVERKLPIDQSKMTAALPAFAEAVRRGQQNEAFNEWFRQQAEQGLRDTPLARPPAQPETRPAPKTGKS
jgi:peptidyl-prolyl cis-trans isomerase D